MVTREIILALMPCALICNLFCAHSVAGGPSTYNLEESLLMASGAVRELLRTTTKTRCAVVLVTDGIVSPDAVHKVVEEIDSQYGVSIYETVTQDRDLNATREHLSYIIKEVTKLRKSHECLSVLAASDSEVFLDTFASIYEFDLLVVWKQRPIIITTLPFSQLKVLLQRHWVLFSGNAMVLHVPQGIFGGNRALLSVYAHLPFSPEEEGQVVLVATWSHQRGLVTASQAEIYPKESENFCCGGRVSVKEALKDPIALGWILQDPKTFKFKVPVLAVVAASHWVTHVTLRKIGDTWDNYEFSGPMANLLNTLAQSLNFTYRLLQPADGQWGSLNPNGTWTGLLGLVHRHEADFTIGPHDVTELRNQWIDFTTPVVSDARKFVVAQNRAKVDPWGFLFPLSSMVWLGTLLALCLVAMVTTAVGHNYKNDPLPTYAYAVAFHTFRLLLNQGLTMKLRTTSERVLVLSWLIAGMLICWSYNTNLMSILAVRYAPKPIQTIQDLLDDDNMVVIFPHRTSLSDYLFSVESGQLKEVADLQKTGRYIDVPYWDFDKALEDFVSHGTHILATDTLDSSSLIANFFSKSGKCQFYIAREAFVHYTLAMICQKGSPMVAAISNRIQRMMEAGLYSYWLDKNLPNATSCRYMPSTFTVKEPLALTNIWGLFVLLASGLALAGLTLCLELFFAKHI